MANLSEVAISTTHPPQAEYRPTPKARAGNSQYQCPACDAAHAIGF